MPLAVVDEIEVPVRLVLAAPPGVADEDVKEIHSQPPGPEAVRAPPRAARRHARRDARHGLTRRGASPSWAGRARRCAPRRPRSRRASSILEEDVSDVKPNATRFWRSGRRSDAGAVRAARSSFFAGTRLAAALADAGRRAPRAAGPPRRGGRRLRGRPSRLRAREGGGARREGGGALVWLGPAPDSPAARRA